MNSKMRVPCAYQGGKQRVASQIVDLLLEAAPGRTHDSMTCAVDLARCQSN